MIKYLILYSTIIFQLLFGLFLTESLLTKSLELHSDKTCNPYERILNVNYSSISIAENSVLKGT